MTRENFIRESSSMLDTILHGEHKVVYISTPITGGERLIEAKLKHKKLAADVAQSVIDENVKYTESKIETLKQFIQKPLLIPYHFRPILHASNYNHTDSEDSKHKFSDGELSFKQADFHVFWQEVIKRYVETMVVMPGWHLSNGCSHEVADATELDVPVLDHALEPISIEKRINLLKEGVNKMNSCDLDCAVVLQSLHRVMDSQNEALRNVPVEEGEEIIINGEKVIAAESFFVKATKKQVVKMNKQSKCSQDQSFLRVAKP